MTKLKTKRLLYSAGLLFVPLFWCSCSQSDDSQEPDDPNNPNPIENVISELEKEGKYTIFIQALKAIELKDTPVTVFAVEDEAFNTSTRSASGISADDLNRHIVKGAYTDLRTVNTLRTIGNEDLEIETAVATINEAEKELIYLNRTIVGDMYKEVDGNIIYSVNRVLPNNALPPSRAEEKDYLEWFAKRMEGLWVVRKTHCYRIITDWSEGKEVHTIAEIDSYKKAYEYNYFERFAWEVVDKERQIYGDYTITKNEALYTISNDLVSAREEKGKWGLAFSTRNDDDLIALWAFPSIGGNLVKYGSVGLDQEYGVGREMKYVCRQLGYSINPPHMYPSQRDSVVYVLQKVAN